MLSLLRYVADTVANNGCKRYKATRLKILCLPQAPLQLPVQAEARTRFGGPLALQRRPERLRPPKQQLQAFRRKYCPLPRTLQVRPKPLPHAHSPFVPPPPRAPATRSP